jgi:hypothetical protein
MKRLEMMEVRVAKIRREIEMKRRRWKMGRCYTLFVLLVLILG